MERTFGEFLKQKRQEKNLTQKELAELLIISPSAISKWEKDVAHPDITLLPKLSEILGVTEHEIITASVDKESREEKVQARKWRVFSFSWSLFFYIAYAVALIPCFICNLAISKTLSWFWIVVSALLLAFTFTNLPKLIKKHRLILIPLSMYLALCLLLGVCCIYTSGKWFFVASIAVLLGMIIIFMPIFIAKYKVFEKIRKYKDFVSIVIVFVVLNILLVVINCFTSNIGVSNTNWYLRIALPIVVSVYVYLNILLCVRFLRVNKLIKTSIILFLINVVYLIIPLIKVSNAELQKEMSEMNIFKADFSNWSVIDGFVDRNVNCIIALTILALGIVFLAFGLIRYFAKKNKDKN